MNRKVVKLQNKVQQSLNVFIKTADDLQKYNKEIDNEVQNQQKLIDEATLNKKQLVALKNDNVKIIDNIKSILNGK